MFRVTIKDCEVQTFRAGGNGGQNQNKRDTGVRVIHHPSGARGEARDARGQKTNKRAAFRRMAESKEFQTWATAQLTTNDILPSPFIDRRVRTYNFARNHVTDHITGKKTTDVQGVLDGNLDLVR